MEKVKMFLMSIMALFVCGLTTGCSTDDILGYDEYFIVLDEVDSNLHDTSGNSLSISLYEAFQFEKGGKSQSLGKDDIAPLEVFEQSCENIKNTLQMEFNGKLPEGGYVAYTFSLRKDSSNGNVEMTKTIMIR